MSTPPAPTPPAPIPPAPTPPRQRLHPLSPVLRGVKSVAVVVAALSWSTLSRIGLEWFVAVVAVLVFGVTVLAVISWYNTGYHVVGRELRVHEGLLWRRTRAIPLERLQSVEVVRPLLARLTGLAELRLEVVGAGPTEAPLAFLGMTDAVALRDQLLVLAGRAGGPVGAPIRTGAPDRAGTGEPAGPEQPDSSARGAGEPSPEPSAAGTMATAGLPPTSTVAGWQPVRNRDLLVSQLLTPQALLLPFGLAFVLVQFLDAGSWSFIAVASTLTAMAGVLLQPVRQVLDDWNFRLDPDHTALRVRHGLLETRAQVVPLDRVQAVRVTWPLLWRPKGWLRLRLQVAGYSAAESDDRDRPDRLLPVGDLRTGALVTAQVLPGVDLTDIPLDPAPRRARWRRPLAQPGLGAGLGDRVFAARFGRLTRQLVLVPYARIQSVRVVQGPVQRRLGLATVHADTAAGSGAVALDQDVDRAWALAAELAERARMARVSG